MRSTHFVTPTGRWKNNMLVNNKRDVLSPFYAFSRLCTRRPCSAFWTLRICRLILRQCWIQAQRIQMPSPSKRKSLRITIRCTFDHTFKNDIGSCARSHAKVYFGLSGSDAKALLCASATLPWVWLNTGSFDAHVYEVTKEAPLGESSVTV